jgi:hypothetical protein
MSTLRILHGRERDGTIIVADDDFNSFRTDNEEKRCNLIYVWNITNSFEDNTIEEVKNFAHGKLMSSGWTEKFSAEDTKKLLIQFPETKSEIGEFFNELNDKAFKVRKKNL